MRTERHDEGLLHDLRAMRDQPARREVLRLFSLAALLPALGCAGVKILETGDDDESGGGDSSGGDSAGPVESCETIPEETEGPYPGDGSNGPDALALDDIVRSDIRSSIGGLSGTAEGVPLTVRIRLVNTRSSCAALSGYAIYIWHCDRDGNYSMYTVTDQNYLRGVQVTDADGFVEFTTIFPGCYSGRWPHIHFEVYPDADAISDAKDKVATSQIALPEATCSAVYDTEGYEDSVRNFSDISLQSDNVFGDGAELQIPDVSGDASSGYVVTLIVGVGA